MEANVVTRFFSYLARGYQKFKLLEPARLRAIWAALILTAGTLGITISTDVDGKVSAVLGFLTLLLPLLQGEKTRSEVVPDNPVASPELYDGDGEGGA